MKRIIASLLALLSVASAAATGIEDRVRSYPGATEIELLNDLKNLPEREAPNYSKANGFVDQAWKAHDRHDDQSAFRLFCYAIIEIPQNGWYFYSASTFLLWNLQKYDAAQLAAAIAFQKDPHPDYQTILACSLQKQGKTEEARKQYLDAFERYKALFESAATWTANEKKERTKQRRSALGLYTHFLYQNLELEEAVKFAQETLEQDSQIDDWYFNEGAGKSAYELANRAFGKRDFDSAVTLYSKAISFLKKNPDSWKVTARYSDPELLLKWAQKRAAMKNVDAPTHFKILLVVVRNADVTVLDSDGKPQRIKTRVEEKQKQAMEDDFYMLSPLFEALSHGAWTLDIDEVVYEGTVTNIVESSFSELGTTSKIMTADFNTIQGDIGQMWKENVDRYDAFALFWNSEKILSEGTGGLIEYPLVPYSVFSNFRAMINVPHGYVPSPELYIFFMHEVFHNVESLASITPTHGFRDGIRQNFPRWKGVSELDYYAWTFENFLPTIHVRGKGDKTLDGFEALSCLDRYPDQSDLSYAAVKKEAESISMADRKAALENVTQASEVYRKNHDVDAARNLCRKALRLNPYLVKALVLLGQIESEAGNKKAALQALQKPAEWETGSWECQEYANLLRDERKDFDQAETYYQKALLIATTVEDRSNAVFQSAENARLKGKLDLALERYRQAVDSAKSDNVWYFAYAQFYKAQIQILSNDKQEQGLRDFRELLEKGKTEAWYFENIQYELIWKKKDYSTARKFLDLRLELSKDRLTRARIEAVYGRVEWESENPQEARRRYQASVEDFPKNDKEKGEALFWNGYVLAQGLKDAKNGLKLMKSGWAMGYQDDWSKKTIDSWSAWLDSQSKR